MNKITLTAMTTLVLGMTTSFSALAYAPVDSKSGTPVERPLPTAPGRTALKCVIPTGAKATRLSGPGQPAVYVVPESQISVTVDMTIAKAHINQYVIDFLLETSSPTSSSSYTLQSIWNNVPYMNMFGVRKPNTTVAVAELVDFSIAYLSDATPATGNFRATLQLHNNFALPGYYNAVPMTCHIELVPYIFD